MDGSRRKRRRRRRRAELDYANCVAFLACLPASLPSFQFHPFPKGRNKGKTLNFDLAAAAAAAAVDRSLSGGDIILFKFLPLIRGGGGGGEGATVF